MTKQRADYIRRLKFRRSRRDLEKKLNKALVGVEVYSADVLREKLGFRRHDE